LGPQPRKKNNTDILINNPAAAKKAQKLPAVRVLSALAQHLDDSREPFASMADILGIEQGELLKIISMYIRAGLIRRFGAVLDHYKIGLKTNALVAWQTDPKDIPAAAKVLSQVRGVSHCYQRKTHPGWPYSVYTMIHARDRRHCREILTLILNAIGDKIKAYRILFTVKELKKTRFEPKQTGRGVYGKKKI
ncbi:MAG: hypothetical protein MUC52_03210, partial [Candidatus Omnitrophica bacterium]|nr:hypothetical protein [Candidatus Omnitrophota bacterium]